MCHSCKINMYVFFFHLSSLNAVYWREMCGCECRYTSDTGCILEDHVAAEGRCRLILNGDAYFFPAP